MNKVIIARDILSKNNYSFNKYCYYMGKLYPKMNREEMVNIYDHIIEG